MGFSIIGIFVLVLTGCQTSGLRPGVNPERGVAAMEVVSDTCRIVDTSNTSAGGFSPSSSSTLINEVSVQPDGWVLIDFSYFTNNQRLSGQAIYDPNTLKGGCSTDRKGAQLLPSLVSYAAVIKNTSTYTQEDLREHVRDYTFPIQILWSGDERIYRGEYVFKGTDISDQAWISMDTPDDSRPCTGLLYSPHPHYKPNPIFYWRLSCPNGKKLNGEFHVPFPNGRTVKFSDLPQKIQGSGTDNYGRQFSVSVNQQHGNRN